MTDNIERLRDSLNCKSKGHYLCRFVKIYNEEGLKVYECDRKDCNITKIMTTQKIELPKCEHFEEGKN